LVAGAGAGGATGGALVCGAVAVPEIDSKTLFRDWPPSKVSTKDVTIKTAAIPDVSFVKKFAPPELPKTV
jgi:hypothetical protein